MTSAETVIVAAPGALVPATDALARSVDREKLEGAPRGFQHRIWARRAADAAVDDLVAAVPGLFDTLPGGDRLADAYRAQLTYRFLQRDIAWLAGLAAHGKLLEAPRLGVQTAVPARVVAALLHHAGRSQALAPVFVFSGLPVPATDGILAFAERWRATTPAATPERASVAFIVGTASEAAWMHDVAARLDPLRSAFVLKKKQPGLEAAAKDASRTARARFSWAGLSRGALEAEEQALLAATLKRLAERLRTADGGTLREHGSWLPAFLDHAVCAIGLQRRMAPDLVIGSLEKSPIGLVLCALAPGLGLRTFNVQHGHIAPQSVLDLLRFDAFGVWDEASGNTVQWDGYRASAARYVVGRPPAAPSPSEEGAAVERLRAWRGARRCLTLFLQPAKPPHVSASATAALLDAATSMLKGGHSTVLLLKPHPGSTAETRATLAAMAAADPAIRLLKDEEDRMSVALALCDVALALNSTALGDAAAAGLSAIAFEPRPGIGSAVLGLPAAIPIARNAADLRALVERASPLADRPASFFTTAVASLARHTMSGAGASHPTIAHVTLQPLESDARVGRMRSTLEAAGYRCPVVGPGHGVEPQAMDKWRKARIALAYGLSARIDERAARAAFFSFSAHRQAVAALTALRPDAIHAHDWDGAIVAQEAARRLDIPFVYDAHEHAADMHAERRGWRWTVAPLVRRLEGPAGRAAARVVTVSDTLADTLRVDLELPERPVTVRNLPDSGDFSSVERKPTLGLLLHYHGILARGRGLEIAIEALRLLPGPVRLRLTGPWRQMGFRTAIERRIEALNLAARVEIVPALDPQALVAHASEADLGLCLLAGRTLHDQGALPNKIFEYLHAGLPVIASGSREVETILAEHECGLSVPPGDPRALADAILSLSPADRSAMSDRARLAARSFTWSRDAPTLLALWRAVLPIPL